MPLCNYPYTFAQNTCPVVKPFGRLQYLNIFTPWFIHATDHRIPTPKLFTALPRHDATNKTVLFILALLVYNPRGGVNGASENKNNFTLCARQPDPKHHQGIMLHVFPVFVGPWVCDRSKSYNYMGVSDGPVK